jgi:hypothetical protein
LVFQTVQASVVEASPPFGDDSPRHVQELGDLLVIQARRSHEDDFGAHHFVVGRGVFPGVFNEDLLLYTRKRDYEGTVA